MRRLTCDRVPPLRLFPERNPDSRKQQLLCPIHRYLSHTRLTDPEYHRRRVSRAARDSPSLTNDLLDWPRNCVANRVCDPLHTRAVANVQAPSREVSVKRCLSCRKEPANLQLSESPADRARIR